MGDARLFVFITLHAESMGFVERHRVDLGTEGNHTETPVPGYTHENLEYRLTDSVTTLRL